MRTTLIAIAALAVTVGCSSSKPSYPASPVPAAMTDLQAARLGGAFMAQQNNRHQLLHSALRQCDGYLLAYTSVFDADGKPPKESHLVIVRNDGSVHEIQFAEGQ